MKQKKNIIKISLLVLMTVLLGGSPSAAPKTVNAMAFPNPYNPDAKTLKITQLNKVPFTGSVKFNIYNMNFQKIYSDVQVGTLLWHGYTKLGTRVPPGLYFIELIEEEITGTGITAEKTYGRKLLRLLIK